MPVKSVLISNILLYAYFRPWCFSQGPHTFDLMMYYDTLYVYTGISIKEKTLA